MTKIIEISSANANKKIIAFLIVCCLLPAVALVGCSKKEKQKAPPDVNSQKQAAAETQAQEKTAAPDDINEPLPPPVPEDVNRGSIGKAPVTTPRTVRLQPKPQKSVKTGQTPSAQPAPELNLSQFDSLADSDAKTEFISDFVDAHPEQAVGLVNKALNYSDAEVRLAAIETLSDNDQLGPEAVPAITKALKDADERVRQAAVEACSSLNSPDVAKILAQAVNDSSEDVRSAAFGAVGDKEPPVRLEVLKAGITSRYADAKEAAVTSLIDLSSPAAVDVLIPALKDPDPDFREDVSSAIEFLISQEFQTYDQAKKWWDANRKKFDDELNEKDSE